MEATETEEAGVPILPGARGDTGEFHHNRRRALLIAAVPGIVVLALVAAACAAAGLVAVGAVAGAVAGLVVWLTLWRGATRILLRALGTRPGGEAELARADNIVDGLCATMGVEPPDIVVMDEWARQAMALGRKSGAAVLVVTSGLLRIARPGGARGGARPRARPREAGRYRARHHGRGGAAAVGDVPSRVGARPRAGGPGSRVPNGPPGGGGDAFPARTARGTGPHGRWPRAPAPVAAQPTRVARTTRWLWTVALPETPGGDVMRWSVVGELDAPALRVAALDEW